MSHEALSAIPLVELLSHRSPMLLLDHVVEHDHQRTTCSTVIRDDALFLEPGGIVPAWVGLEYMAQCIAVHAGLQARAAGRRPPMGFLIGSRQIDFRASGYACGQSLLISAEHVWGETGLASFACRIEDAHTRALLAEGMVKVFSPGSSERFKGGTTR